MLKVAFERVIIASKQIIVELCASQLLLHECYCAKLRGIKSLYEKVVAIKKYNY